MEHTFLPRAALPPVSCLNSCYHQTWELSLILLPPLPSHISHQSLKTLNTDSTLPPGLLTLPSSGYHSSPAPLQQLYRPSLAPSFPPLQIHPPHSNGEEGFFKTKINNLLTSNILLCPCVWNALLTHNFAPSPPPQSSTSQFRHRLLQEDFADHHSIPFHFASSQSIWGPSSLLSK